MSDTATEAAPTVTPDVTATDPVVEAAVAAPETAAEVTTQEATPETTPEEQKPTGPFTRKQVLARRREQAAKREQERATEARSATPPEATLAEAAEAAPSEAVVDEKGRKHDPETGKFLPDEDGETEGAEAGATEPAATEQDTEQDTEAQAADGRAADEATDPPAAEAADKLRVEITKGHPIREMGLDAFSASSPIEEQALRALLNGTYSRRQDVESRETTIKERDTTIRELREKLIRREANEAATEKWQQTDAYKEAVEEYQGILDTHGQDAASRYWAGRQNDFKTLSEQEYGERMGKVEQEEVERNRKQYSDMAWNRADQGLNPAIRALPDFGRWFKEEMDSFDRGLALGHFEHVTTMEQANQTFDEMLKNRLMREQSVRDAMQREVKAKQAPAAAAQPAKPAKPAISAEEIARREKAAADKAVAEFKRQAASKQPNPLSSLPHSSATERTEPEPLKTAGLSPHGAKKAFRERARERARSAFST